jgi:hypothetical protein
VRHTIIPLRGTDHVGYGMRIAEVEAKFGPPRKVMEINLERVYFWEQGFRVKTSCDSDLLTYIAYSDTTDLFFGDIAVFKMPHLVLLFAAYDPEPWDTIGWILFSKLGVGIEAPDGRYGYDKKRMGRSSLDLELFDQIEMDKFRAGPMPRQLYDWKQWIKPNLLGVYPPPEEG